MTATRSLCRRDSVPNDLWGLLFNRYAETSRASLGGGLWQLAWRLPGRDGPAFFLLRNGHATPAPSTGPLELPTYAKHACGKSRERASPDPSCHSSSPCILELGTLAPAIALDFRAQCKLAVVCLSGSGSRPFARPILINTNASGCPGARYALDSQTKAWGTLADGNHSPNRTSYGQSALAHGLAR